MHLTQCPHRRLHAWFSPRLKEVQSLRLGIDRPHVPKLPLLRFTQELENVRANVSEGGPLFKRLGDLLLRAQLQFRTLLLSHIDRNADNFPAAIYMIDAATRPNKQRSTSRRQ